MEYDLQWQEEKPVLCNQPNSEAFGFIQQRRSANYKPNIWEYDFLQSLNSKYNREEYKRRTKELREKVKYMFVEAEEELSKLELIDMIRKLGLADLFAEDIQKALQAVASSMNGKVINGAETEEELYITALRFRILRQHGYEVLQDMFNVFLDENGKFSESKCTKIKGLIELFEASYLAFEEENILGLAKTFSTKKLRNCLDSTMLDSTLSKEVTHALELTTHWRVQWFDVKWHITKYECNKSIHKSLLELAKLNFNAVQATLQNDLSEISRWWTNLGLMKHLKFTRDRLTESFLCAVGLAYEPQFSCFRKCLTKITTMILVIDDVYDVYGSIEELEQFTDAVDCWDSSKLQQMPECMKICFQALYDITNEIAYDIQELHGWKCNVQALLHLRNAWAGFVKALFVEAKWYNDGYTPSLQEYLNNAIISSGGIVISVHSMLSVTHQIADEMVIFLGKNQDLVYNVSLIIRLCNDLGTSMAEKERGDAPSSIHCYMKEKNVSEEEAQEHVKEMITKTWKKINEQCLSSNPSPSLQSFVKVTINVARMVHCLYQFGDGFGIQDRETRRHILSLLIEPFIID